jgi:hypothetical protein
MSNRNKTEIASKTRNLLISQYGYQTDGDYVRKWVSDNYGISFFHDDEYPLCLSVYHRDGAAFSPVQKNRIFDVLSRKEFSSKHNAPKEGETSDGKPEIYTTVKIDSFDGWENEDIAKWIARLYEHFVNSVNLLELT